MDLEVKPTQKVSGKVKPSPSKFFTQFAVATSLLAEGKSVINSPLLVDDTRYLAKTMEKVMGATTKRSKNTWSIWGNGRSISPSDQKIEVKKSMMNLTLLSSLSALTSRVMVVTGKSQVNSQPVPTLLSALKKLGVDIHSTKPDESPPLIIFESKIKGGKIVLEEDTNPRFLPAFLLLTPLADEGIELKYTPNFKTSITDMTVQIMKERNIEISRTQRRLRISPGEYKPAELSAPLDVFSTLPYILGAVLTGSKLRISKISKSTGLEAFTNLLEKMGIEMERTSRSLKIAPNQEIRGKRYGLEEFPDLIPFAAVLACTANGKTRIINAERARNRVPDRISATANELQKMGAKIEETDDGLIVEGTSNLEGARVNGYEDDILVAALGVAGLSADGKTIVENRAETLRESYPRFVSTFQNLGADIGYRS